MVAVLLPVQRFVRATEQKVYADSRRISNQFEEIRMAFLDEFTANFNKYSDARISE